jgi:putative restriction endonuclease
VPFLTPYKGIYRAAVQRGPAALSINTSSESPYDDRETADGFLYAYRAGAIDQSDNRALRAAHVLGVPIVYFVATRAGRYRVLYPCYVQTDDPPQRAVIVSVGSMAGPMDEREAVPFDDPLERRYANRLAKVRLHQARFRGCVLTAYRDQCTICRLKEIRLLDAAHIVGDADPEGEAVVSNGLSLCSIHHKAYDEDLMGVSPDFTVHISQRLLADEDGPMLEVLKTFEGVPIALPRSRSLHPDRERLELRFAQFRRLTS